VLKARLFKTEDEARAFLECRENNARVCDVQWEHSEYQGVGIESFPPGSSVTNYIGQFHQGSWHGCGTCQYTNGTVYSGEWLLGKHHGLGRMVRLSAILVHWIFIYSQCATDVVCGVSKLANGIDETDR
jgi:hypothetical protein